MLKFKSNKAGAGRQHTAVRCALGRRTSFAALASPGRRALLLLLLLSVELNEHKQVMRESNGANTGTDADLLHLLHLLWSQLE